MLTERFFCELNSTKLLLRPYPSQKSAEFQQVLAESEEEPGDKYVFKGGLSTITIPLHLYEKYIKLNDKPDQEISYRMFLHKRRIDAFEMQARHFQFKDICFIESLFGLIEEKKYSSDENYMLKNNIPDYKDIICHLENLIDLLKTYNNYNIAFVSQAHFAHMTNINWMVKGKHSVLIEAEKNDLPDDKDCFQSEMNFVITEKDVVNAFHDHFLILWDSIPDESKNKKNSISWLRSLIKKCKRYADQNQ
jgi:hypothetical protein